MSRYRMVRATPIEVRDALRTGELLMADAERIASLDEVARAEVARRLREGENARQVVAELVDLPGRHAALDAGLERLTMAHDRACESYVRYMVHVRGESPAHMPPGQATANATCTPKLRLICE